MKVISGVVAGDRLFGDEAQAAYDKRVGGGFEYVCIDASAKSISGMLHMTVAANFEVVFDSRAEAADFYLSASVTEVA